jgi:hypothetical protein
VEFYSVLHRGLLSVRESAAGQIARRPKSLPIYADDGLSPFHARAAVPAQSTPDSTIVYVPAHPSPTPGRGVVRFETRCLPGGEAVGVAFRSQSALVEALGQAKPWIALPLSRLEVILGAAGIAHTLIDPPVDESAVWWTPERVSALAERLDGDRG